MRLDTTTNTPPGAAPTPNTPHSTAGPDAPPAAHDASPVSPGDQVGTGRSLAHGAALAVAVAQLEDAAAKRRAVSREARRNARDADERRVDDLEHKARREMWRRITSSAVNIVSSISSSVSALAGGGAGTGSASAKSAPAEPSRAKTVADWLDNAATLVGGPADVVLGHRVDAAATDAERDALIAKRYEDLERDDREVAEAAERMGERAFQHLDAIARARHEALAHLVRG